MAKRNGTAPGAPSAKKPPKSPPPRTVSVLESTLNDIRYRLGVIRAVVATANRALESQRADSDPEVVLTIRHCVGNELDRLIERFDEIRLTPLISGGARCIS
jgi:hypothetical protein